ncbi:hypothetical protein IT570_11320 [Candidatus Sumerlaeota bacterium]|nr:hypothetical protein [Candidatus Sumerlaeota bacterium]
MKKGFLALAAITLICGNASALNIIVAPSTGVGGSSPTNTIADAITQINAGVDTNNTITLRSTEGALVQADNLVLTLNANKNVDFVAESGRPVIIVSWAAGQFCWSLSTGAGCAVTFTGIGFAPEIDLGYANNTADGIALTGTGASFSFDDCIFAANDGSNGLSTLDGSAPFLAPTSASPSVGGRNVGDDWIQLSSNTAALTFSNCVITGCNDDAIVVLGGGGSPQTVTIDNGTVVANVGGAGYQAAGSNIATVIDGTAGRVLFAKCGLRGPFAAATDTGPKFFGSVGVTLNMTKTDVVEVTNGGVYFFGNNPSATITDCRIALNNSGNVSPGGNIAFGSIAAGPVVTNVTLDYVTVHDSAATANTDGVIGAEGATLSAQNYAITNSIFSGTGDTYANMKNDTSGAGASTLNVSTSAIVTAGAHAITTLGDLTAASGSSVTADPVYASLTYTIGRSQTNADFLRPTDAAYLTASSSSGLIGGIRPPSSVASWDLF